MVWFSLAVQAADGKNKNLLRHTDLVFRADLVQTVSGFHAEISVHESLIFVPRRVFASIQLPRGYSTYVLNSKTPDFSISGVLFYHISHQTLQSLIFHHFSSFLMYFATSQGLYIIFHLLRPRAPTFIIFSL